MRKVFLQKDFTNRIDCICCVASMFELSLEELEQFVEVDSNKIEYERCSYKNLNI